jgi:hypothetical protein
MVSSKKLAIGSIVCLFAKNELVEVTEHSPIDSEDARLGDYRGVIRRKPNADGDRVFFDAGDISQVVMRA